MYINNAKENLPEVIEYRRIAFVIYRTHLSICDFNLGNIFVRRPHDNSINVEREKRMGNS
jgi:hypothetical protein